MTIADACPDTSAWAALLAADAEPDAGSPLARHLAACASCRAAFESAASGGLPWLADAPPAGEPAPDGLVETLLGLCPAEATVMPELTLADPELAEVAAGGAGVTLGPYEVHGVIGRGGMGIVLRGYDPRLMRPVALKVPAPHLRGDPAARARFRREAQAAACVAHPNVVAVHAVEEVRGVPVIVMALIAGESLAERVGRDGPLPAAEALRIAAGVADGLAAAHARGLVHRDVKPANVLLEGADAEVRLTDFGLARSAECPRLTRTGVAAGTPTFMAPEQIEGHPIDHRADLFALGGVLYAALTGRPPFGDATLMNTLRRVCDGPPDPMPAAVPRPVRELTMSLLEKNPLRRPPSAAEAARRIRACLDALTAAPDPATRRRARRRSLLTGVGVLLLAGALLAGVTVKLREADGTLVVEVDDPAARVTLSDGVELNLKGGVDEVRLRPGSHTITVTRAGSPPTSERVTVESNGKTVVRLKTPTAPTTSATPADSAPGSVMLEPEAYYLWMDPRLGGEKCAFALKIQNHRPVVQRCDLCHAAQTGPGSGRNAQPIGRTISPRRTFAGLAGPVLSLAQSADGKTLSGSTEVPGDRAIQEWDLETGKAGRALRRDVVSSLPDHQTGISVYGSGAVWNRGDTVATAAGSEVRLDRQKDGKTELVRRVSFDAPVTALAFSPDGARLAVHAFDGSVTLLDTKTGEKQCTGTVGRGRGPARVLRFTPDGTGVIVGDIGLTRLDVGTARPNFTTVEGGVSAVAFSPDGRTMAVVASGLTFRDSATGQESRGYALLAGPVYALLFSRDGRSLFVGGDGKVWEFDVPPAADKPEPPSPVRRAFAGHTGAVRSLALSADGKTLFSATASAPDRTVREWDLATGKPGRVLTGHDGDAPGLVTDAEPDVAAMSESGEILVWKPGDTTPSREAVSPVRPVRRFAWNERTRTAAVANESAQVFLVRDAQDAIVHRLILDSPAESLAFSPDGSRLAVGSRSGTVYVWDTKTIEGVWTTGRGRGPVVALRWTPDGTGLFAGDGGLARLDAGTGRVLYDCPNAGQTTAVALTPDGQRAVSADAAGAIRFWDARSGQATGNLVAPGRPHTLELSKDGTRVYIGGDGKVWEFDVPVPEASPVAELPEKPRRTFAGHTGGVNLMEASADGKYLLSVSSGKSGDGTCRAWSLPSGELGRVVPVEASVVGLFPARSEDFVCAINDLGRMKGWKLDGPLQVEDKDHPAKPIGPVQAVAWNGRSTVAYAGPKAITVESDAGRRAIPTTSPAIALAFPPDGTRVIAGSADGRVLALDLATGATAWEAGVGGSAVALRSQPGGPGVFVSVGSILTCLDAETGRVRHTQDLGTRGLALAVSPDGRRAAAATIDGRVTVFRAADGANVRSFRATAGVPLSLAFAADGGSLFVGAGPRPGPKPGSLEHIDATAIAEFELPPPEPETPAVPRRTFAGHTGAVRLLSLSPDGKTLGTAGTDRTVHLRQAEAGRSGGRILEAGGEPAFVDPGGAGRSRLILDRVGNSLEWAPGQSEPARVPRRFGPIRRVARAADGRLAIAGEDGVLQISAIDSRTQPIFLTTDCVATALAFSPDGKYLASANEKGWRHVYESATGKQEAGRIDGAGKPLALAFSPDGSRLYVADGVGVAVREAGTDRLLREYATAGPQVALAVSPDGKRLVTASASGRVTRWDADSLRPTGTFLADPAGAYSVLFSADGRRVYVGGDGKVWEFDAP